jgi:hypothetical protein
MPDNASHVAVPTDRDAGQAGKLKLTTVYRNGSTLAGYREVRWDTARPSRTARRSPPTTC